MIAILARLTGFDRVIVWVLVAALVVAGVWSVHRYIKAQGAAEARRQIERQNHEAAREGGEARMSFRDCLDGGGVYDFRTGDCAAGTPGNR